MGLPRNRQSLLRSELTAADTKGAKASNKTRRACHREIHKIAFIAAFVNDHAGFDSGKDRSFLLWDAKPGIDERVRVKSLIDGSEQDVSALTCLRRSGHSTDGGFRCKSV